MSKRRKTNDRAKRDLGKSGSGAMHLSKRTLYIGIIAYSAAVLLFWDMPAGLETTGTVSLVWFCKMAVDCAFAAMAVIRLAGPALFAEDDDDEEVAFHEEDLHFSDTALYGAFFVNLLANGGWHVYMYTTTTDAESLYYLIWAFVEVFALFLTWIMWKHAITSQKRVARKAREAAVGSGGSTFRKVS